MKQFYLMSNYFKCKLIKLFAVKCKCINSPIKQVDWQNGLNFGSGLTICYLWKSYFRSKYTEIEIEKRKEDIHK